MPATQIFVAHKKIALLKFLLRVVCKFKIFRTYTHQKTVPTHTYETSAPEVKPQISLLPTPFQIKNMKQTNFCFIHPHPTFAKRNLIALKPD